MCRIDYIGENCSVCTINWSGHNVIEFACKYGTANGEQGLILQYNLSFGDIIPLCDEWKNYVGLYTCPEVYFPGACIQHCHNIITF